MYPSFVSEIPDSIEPGLLYISLESDAMIHLCACGCGHEVVTPISPTDWRICWNGADITVRPSIGNGALHCRSHYVIDAGKVKWHTSMSDRDIAAEQLRTAKAKGLHIPPFIVPENTDPPPLSHSKEIKNASFIGKFFAWMARRN